MQTKLCIPLLGSALKPTETITKGTPFTSITTLTGNTILLNTALGTTEVQTIMSTSASTTIGERPHQQSIMLFPLLSKVPYQWSLHRFTPHPQCHTPNLRSLQHFTPPPQCHTLNLRSLQLQHFTPPPQCQIFKALSLHHIHQLIFRKPQLDILTVCSATGRRSTGVTENTGISIPPRTTGLSIPALSTYKG
jgi:hypothetical protein